MRVGQEFAVQPGRGKKAVCRARVVSIRWHRNWQDGLDPLAAYRGAYDRALKQEARREGFKTWQGVLAWLAAHKIDVNATWRIEFEVI